MPSSLLKLYSIFSVSLSKLARVLQFCYFFKYILLNILSGRAPTGWPRSSSEGPGFWTGAATGGLVGYLFGNRGTDACERCVYDFPVERTSAPPVERNFEPASYFASDSPYVSDQMSDMVTSTGFGGTDRR
ncbi:store-operated calcium entry-associated regulatory factor-like [Rhipicephalus microplus]|uniref:store-operated calcium entry-associated regulatory factor-like n=1 Tax=Rhipicephalus microplus TaxID=6941 RepID=UPI003F6D7E45